MKKSRKNMTAGLKVACLTGMWVSAIFLGVTLIMGAPPIPKMSNQASVGELNIAPASYDPGPELYREGSASSVLQLDYKDPTATKLSLPDEWRLDWKNPDENIDVNSSFGDSVPN